LVPFVLVLVPVTVVVCLVSIGLLVRLLRFGFVTLVYGLRLLHAFILPAITLVCTFVVTFGLLLLVLFPLLFVTDLLICYHYVAPHMVTVVTRSLRLFPLIVVVPLLHTVYVYVVVCLFRRYVVVVPLVTLRYVYVGLVGFFVR